MPSFLQDNLKNHCSGCGACAQVCAANAVKLKEDDDGFVYPEIDSEKCINCDRCVSACPFNKDIEENDFQRYFAAKSKDKNVIKNSSSGGAFYEISKTLFGENYIIFGAEMTEDLKVRHTCIEDFSEIHKLQKSKYVQSDTGNTFRKIRALLKENKKVLFSGTPCQVKGLKGFLGRDYDGLVTVDIVCHGVPPQKLFDKYTDELSAELGEKVTSFTFRNKKNFEKKSCNQKTVLIKTESGKETVKEVLQCEYLAAFHEALFYRQSCGECPFACTDRVGDITLADFWGAEKFFPDFDDGKGLSLVIANTEKGMEILEKTDMEFRETGWENAVKYNAQLRRPVRFHKNRDEFFELNKTQSFCKSVRECMKIPSSMRYRLYKIKKFVK